MESLSLNRHRDRAGELGRLYGNVLVRTLRDAYGLRFAIGFFEHLKLADVLQKLDDASLAQLVRDHMEGRLEGLSRTGLAGR